MMDEKNQTAVLDDVDQLLDWDEFFGEEESAPSEMMEPHPEASENEKGQSYWEALFNEMHFPGMDLMAVVYQPKPIDLFEKRAALKRVSRDFLKFIGYHHMNDLRSAGISEEGIFLIKKGKLPENFTVHLKYPVEYGGEIDFNNMVFMQSRPFHESIHEYLDKQLISENGSVRPKFLYVPVPVGKIYIPFALFTGSGGKNKQDRSAVSGFSQSALKDIAIKNMPGR